MHEAHLAEDLVAVAVGEAKKRHASRIRKVRFRVGSQYRIVPEALEMGFQLATQGTIAEGAELEVEQVPLGGRCRACGSDVEAEEPPLVCEACGSLDVEMLRGNEMILETLELEEGVVHPDYHAHEHPEEHMHPHEHPH